MKISKQRVLLLLAEQRRTMKDLAESMEMKPQNLSGILNRGSCNPITAARIADGLKVSVQTITEEV